jgi:uncharacterized protein (DUF4415 family)
MNINTENSDSTFQFEVVEDNGKDVVINIAQNDYESQINNGVPENETLPPGKHHAERDGFFKRHPNLTGKDCKIKVTMYLDADILTHFKQRAENEHSAPYQTQINAELRKIMESEQSAELIETAKTIVGDNVIERLADKIAERLNERKAA